MKYRFITLLRPLFPSLFLFLFLFLFQSNAVEAQKVGLVLSGGGARGLSHIGVIKALEEEGIPIDYITGTSMGSLIGAMYATGMSAAEMETLVESDSFYQWANGIIPKNLTYYFKKRDDNASWITLKFRKDSVWSTSLPNSIINSIPMEFALMERTGAQSAGAGYKFDSLFVPYRCVAADIDQKSQVIFDHGDLGEAVRASMAYPFYFNPVYFENRVLFDGGLYNNFPADVMLAQFNPDYVIGVDASNDPNDYSNIDRENIIEQVKTMVMRKTQYSIFCDNAVMIEPVIGRVGLLDLDNIPAVINSGYIAAKAKIVQIKRAVVRKVSREAMSKKREIYKNKLPAVQISDIRVEGLNSKQSFFVRKFLMPKRENLSIEKLKKNYYKLIADDNVKTIFPKLFYHPETGLFDLQLRMKRERDLMTQFGGNFSSRPINEAFVGLQYNVWEKNSLVLNANSYFGKLYNSGQIKARIDPASRLPYYIEAVATINGWDFFKSSTTFFEDIKPSYLTQTDRALSVNLGFPGSNKEKLYIGNSLISISDDYYQTTQFEHGDTTDRTTFFGYSPYFVFEHNSLNRKQYPSSGALFRVNLRFVTGDEHNLPGSTAIDRTETFRPQQYFKAHFVYDNYFKQRGHIRLGFYGEAVASNQKFSNNYIATSFSASAFQPTPESQTFFMSQYRAHNYGAAGLKYILALRYNIDFRLEGYVFQPLRPIIAQADLHPTYGKAFDGRVFMGTVAAVYSTPIGPVSLSLNWYDQKENPFSLMFHFGYILFNQKAID